MKITARNYRTTATALWLAGGGFMGLALGERFGMSEQRVLFMVIALVGAVLLVRINVRPRQKLAVVPRLAVGKKVREERLQSGIATEATGAEIAGSVEALLSRGGDGQLGPGATRKWLDDFLVRQQRK